MGDGKEMQANNKEDGKMLQRGTAAHQVLLESLSSTGQQKSPRGRFPLLY